MNLELRFDNYVVREGNHFAYATANTVMRNPAKYNPFFVIYI
jgi:chromosomal replication initiation ATPase DnaA